jgi:hypothetical protein
MRWAAFIAFGLIAAGAALFFATSGRAAEVFARACAAGESEGCDEAKKLGR